MQYSGHLTNHSAVFLSLDQSQFSILVTLPIKLILPIFSVYFESMPYRLSEETGLIDYEMLEVKAKLYCTVLYTVLY